jgi:hypothetical protein
MWEAEIGRIVVLGQPRQKKFVRPHLNGIKVVCFCYLSDGRKHKIGSSWSRPAWAKSEILSAN